ncbi:Putative uncharacterized transposon-derived protein F52C9.6 [Eumeta japonica]|uniref:Uncharacterized transposon-derived protein F52C9.6 n=1 Tax=Eumeta variegata TaxID=151549 RepID=A0A4C1UYK7_EUMVA|nr:Putative uncharacterized transposon-derived protein F52C9.6 [Eumeta japonica]
MGDFNGQIGECHRDEEYIVGSEGNGTRSKNGERLVNFCLDNKLRQLISPTENMQKEIERRITNIWKRFWSLTEIMKNKEMTMSVKRKVYNVCILPCLTYACQTWALIEQQKRKINICQNEIERNVLGVKKRDKIQLKRINEKTKFRKVQTVCRKLKWQWTGLMLRERKEKWTKLITEWRPRGNNRSTVSKLKMGRGAESRVGDGTETKSVTGSRSRTVPRPETKAGATAIQKNGRRHYIHVGEVAGGKLL